MSMEFSAEDFINDGMGVKATPKYTVSSTEGFDGWSDNLSMEMYRAEQELKSLEHFEAISNLNATQKLNMVKRIAKNYVGTINNNYASNSIESVCMAQIKSLEDAAPAPKKDTVTDSPKTEKKMGFMKTIFHAIKTFFEKIWEFIMKGISWFTGKIKSLFAKKKVEDETTTDDKSDLTNNNSASGNNADSSSTGNLETSVSKGKALDEKLQNLKMCFDRSATFNPTNANKFITEYTNLSSFAKKMQNDLKASLKAVNKEEKAANKANANANHGEGNGKTYNKDSNVNAAYNTAYNAATVNTIVTKTNTIGGLFNLKNIAGMHPGNAKDAKEIKEYFTKFEQGIRVTTRSDDDLKTIVSTLFGVKTVPQEQFKKYLNNKDYKDQLERLANSVSNYYEKAFVAQLNKPHETLVNITNDLETTLNSRLGSSSVSFGTTQNLSAIQAMLKMCCALEQTVGKIVTSINTSIVGQIGLMKVQKK